MTESILALEVRMKNPDSAEIVAHMADGSTQHLEISGWGLCIRNHYASPGEGRIEGTLKVGVRMKEGSSE